MNEYDIDIIFRRFFECLTDILVKLGKGQDDSNLRFAARLIIAVRGHLNRIHNGMAVDPLPSEIHSIVVAFGLAAKKYGIDAEPLRRPFDLSASGHVDEQPSSDSPEEIKLDDRAMALYAVDPSQTKKGLAKKLCCHPKSLAPRRCPRLAMAIAAYKAPSETPPGKRRRASNLDKRDEDDG